MSHILKVNFSAFKSYDVEQLIELAMSQQILIGTPPPTEIEMYDCTLKYLTSLPFEIWAELIEIENNLRKV